MCTCTLELQITGLLESSENKKAATECYKYHLRHCLFICIQEERTLADNPPVFSMLGEGVTPGICQSDSTATFSTLFPLSLWLQKESRDVRERSVVVETIKGQPTKDFSPKALRRVLNCHGER